MRKIVLCLLFFMIIFFINVAEARWCHMGAENFYRNFESMLTSNYEYSELEHLTSPNGNDVYAFEVANHNTKKSECRISAIVDSDGYIKRIGLVYTLTDSDISDISTIQKLCLYAIGLSQSEIEWTAKHEETRPVTRQFSIKHSEVFSKKNDTMVYLHKVPVGGGLTLVDIDGRTHEEYYDTFLKHCIVS